MTKCLWTPDHHIHVTTDHPLSHSSSEGKSQCDSIQRHPVQLHAFNLVTTV